MSKPYTKAEVDYSKGLPQAHCGICEHYRDHSCEIVEGEIEPDHWCRKFKRALRGAIEKAIKGEKY